jgi:ubiquinone/menaquinone biosynthesis C-methylase UbiE
VSGMTGAERLQATQAFWDSLTGAEGEFAQQAEYGRAMWSAEPNWGDWSIPESQLRLLPDVAGMDTIELGCGTAYFSAWLARAGARPVALDASARQLSLARALQEEHGLEFPLVHADAEQVPYPDATFDLALSEYGASSWCDPHRWLPEAARLLRPGGWLLFLTVSPFLTVCSHHDGSDKAGDRLLRPYFGMYEIETPAFGTTEFQLSYGDWVRVLRAAGFTIEGLTEIQAPAGGTTPWPFVDADWAHRWPSECVWIARKIGDAGTFGLGK